MGKRNEFKIRIPDWLDPDRFTKGDRIETGEDIGPLRDEWREIDSFDEILEGICTPEYMEDIFLPDDMESIFQEEWKSIKLKKYLNIIDGFFLATKVRLLAATFRFRWGDKVYFNIRSDFCLRSLVHNLEQKPINVVEEKLHERLSCYHLEVDSLSLAIKQEELYLHEHYSIKWWIDFWSERGIAVTVPDSYDLQPSKTLPEGEMPPVPDYLNPDRPHYSEELATAIKGWKYAAKKNPPKNGFKAAVEDYVKTKPLSKDAKKRIAIIANPYKGSGPRGKKNN